MRSICFLLGLGVALPLAKSASHPPLLGEALDVVLIEEDINGGLTELALGSPGIQLGERPGFFWRYEGLASTRNAWEPPREQWAELELAHGQRLHGVLEGGRGEDLVLRLAADVLVAVALDDLQALALPHRLQVEGGRELLAPTSGDRLYRRRGDAVDRIDGLVQGFSEAGLSFESDLGSKTYPWSEIAGLFVEELGDDQAAAGGDFIVDLRGGNRLRATIEEVDQAGVRLRWGSFARALAVPATQIVEIARRSEAWLSLSELTPDDIGPTGPFEDNLGASWPPRMDQSQAGEVLSAGGREYGRGIGVHAPSRIRWQLGAAYASLRLEAGVDEQVGRGTRGGSVRFRIWLDQRQVYESGLVRAGDPVLALPTIDLSGAQTLILEVDPGSDSFVLDRAHWLRPILVRK